MDILAECEFNPMAETKPIHECILFLHTTWVAVSAGHGRLKRPMKEAEMRAIEEQLKNVDENVETEL